MRFILIALCLLIPSFSYAQQEVLACGQDSSLTSRPLRTDSTGQLYSIPAHDPNASVTNGVSVRQTKVVTQTTSLVGNGTACTSPSGASCKVVLNSTRVLEWSNVAFTVTNTNPNGVDNILVEVSADNASWELWDSATFSAFPAGSDCGAGSCGIGTVKSIQLSGNSRYYIRAEARAAIDTAFTVTLTMNDG